MLAKALIEWLYDQLLCRRAVPVRPTPLLMIVILQFYSLYRAALRATRPIRCAKQACSLGPSGYDRERFKKMSGIF